MSVQVSYKKQTLFGIIMILLILISIEVVLRTNDFVVLQNKNCDDISRPAFSNYDTNIEKEICLDSKKISWYYSPTSAFSPNQNLQTININSDGLRGLEINEKLENTYRIILIGGSTVFGAGSSSDETTISGFLQKKIDERYDEFNIEVINGGILGSDSRTEAFNTKNKFLKFKPDLLIVYGGWNDGSHLWSPIGFDFFPVSQYNVIDTIYFPFFRTGLFFYNHYKAMSTTEQDIPKLVNSWEERWQKICEQGKSEGFDVIVTVQPVLGTGDKFLTSNEHMIWEDKKMGLIGLHMVLDEMVKKLPNMKSSCTDVADLRMSFDDISEDLFFDGGHTNDLGNKIISQKIYEKILPTILDDISK